MLAAERLRRAATAAAAGTRGPPNGIPGGGSAAMGNAGMEEDAAMREAIRRSMQQ